MKIDTICYRTKKILMFKTFMFFNVMQNTGLYMLNKEYLPAS